MWLGSLAVVDFLNNWAADADAGVAAGRALDGLLLGVRTLISLNLRIRNVHGSNTWVVLLGNVVWVTISLERDDS